MSSVHPGRGAVVSTMRPSIAAIGAGSMGRGIALSFAYAGHHVALVDSEQRPPDGFKALQTSVAEDLARELTVLQDVGAISARQAEAVIRKVRVVTREAAAEVLRDANFIFEAVAEVIEVKSSTYAWLNGCMADGAIVASTTSTMLADTLAAFVRGNERYTNAHWLNPAHLMPLVEISPGKTTTAATVASLRRLLESIGKVPVVCAASPGYIVSRIQALAMNEAARMVEEGVAPAAEIDKAIRAGFGIRYAVLGLLEFIDWGGGDILYYASHYLADNIDRQRFATPGIIEENMREGRNGLRDRIGFYDYRNRDLDVYRRERIAAFAGLLRHLGLMPAPGAE